MLYGLPSWPRRRWLWNMAKPLDFRCSSIVAARLWRDPGSLAAPTRGIFAYWINSWRQKRPLRYLGFGGQGHQVRDCLHPRDLVPLLEKQFVTSRLPPSDRLINISGVARLWAMSLRQLSDWCARRFGPHPVVADGTPCPFDIPWIVLDHTKATRLWNWQPTVPTPAILEEIALHAERNPDWLDLSAPF